MPDSELQQFLAEPGLTFPPVPSRKHPAGRSYTVPSPDHRTGLLLTAIVNLGMSVNAAQQLDDSELQDLEPDERRVQEQLRDRIDKLSKQLNDEPEQSPERLALGPVYDELVADGVPWRVMQRMGTYALFAFGASDAAADQMVRVNLGNQQAPNRAERRASKPSRPASSESATSTRSRGSTSGTTSARSSKRRKD